MDRGGQEWMIEGKGWYQERRTGGWVSKGENGSEGKLEYGVGGGRGGLTTDP